MSGISRIFPLLSNLLLISCSGAVFRGLEGNRVEARFSRSWYGVTSDTTFEKHRHARHSKHWCQLKEKWLVHDYMTWYIKKVGKIGIIYFLED